jgi:predicted flap endonuclease-1-like 5' DNA nuclease
MGVTNTKELYEKVRTVKDRRKLADLTDIDYSDILECTKLSDLSRIKWVGVTYAQLLYDLGLDTVEKVSKADPNELHQRINQRIKEHTIFNGGIGLNDVRILVETAKELPLDVEY